MCVLLLVVVVVASACRRTVAWSLGWSWRGHLWTDGLVLRAAGEEAAGLLKRQQSTWDLLLAQELELKNKESQTLDSQRILQTQLLLAMRAREAAAKVGGVVMRGVTQCVVLTDEGMYVLWCGVGAEPGAGGAEGLPEADGGAGQPHGQGLLADGQQQQQQQQQQQHQH
jgi:hypothetical protein